CPTSQAYCCDAASARSTAEGHVARPAAGRPWWVSDCTRWTRVAWCATCVAPSFRRTSAIPFAPSACMPASASSQSSHARP
ncbi:MAG: hypothetical protein AVDCRST_MAG88-1421, partial [uncultured Thermomicrobiales bacterium]